MAESLFTAQTPALPDNSDGTPGISTATTVEFAAAGTVSGIRFHATATISGNYTAELWRVDTGDDVPSGTLLGAKNVTAASLIAGTWNVVPFAAPIAVTTDALYRAVIWSDDGRYVATVDFFTGADLINGSITAWRNTADPIGLGTLRQGTYAISPTTGSYPVSPGNGTSYFVDVVFEAAGPVTVAAEGRAHTGVVASGAGTKAAPGVGTSRAAVLGAATSSKVVASAGVLAIGGYAACAPVAAVIPGVLVAGGTAPILTAGGTAPILTAGGTAPILTAGGTAPILTAAGITPTLTASGRP